MGAAAATGVGESAYCACGEAAEGVWVEEGLIMLE